MDEQCAEATCNSLSGGCAPEMKHLNIHSEVLKQGTTAKGSAVFQAVSLLLAQCALQSFSS